MRKCLNALLIAVAVTGASTLHAEPGQAAGPGGLWRSLQEQPTMLALASLGLVLLLGLGIVLWRRAAGKGEPAAFENTYDAGFETIQPIRLPRHDPNRQSLSRHASTGARTDTVVAPPDVPADFDVPRFLRRSKATFIRLQAAWDQGDLQDIRRLTTRELSGEFCRQLQERGGAPSVTEVVTLGAELHSMETVDEYYLAKVRFSGMIREDAGAQAMPFAETWKLSKPLDGHRSWIVDAIEQH